MEDLWRAQLDPFWWIGLRLQFWLKEKLGGFPRAPVCNPCGPAQLESRLETPPLPKQQHDPRDYVGIKSLPPQAFTWSSPREETHSEVTSSTCHLKYYHLSNCRPRSGQSLYIQKQKYIMKNSFRWFDMENSEQQSFGVFSIRVEGNKRARKNQGLRKSTYGPILSFTCLYYAALLPECRLHTMMGEQQDDLGEENIHTFHSW